MKILHGNRWAGLAAVLVGFATAPTFAQEAASSGEPAPMLPYGVSDVIKLSQAQVSENTIITYIKNSGNSYGLDAEAILYMRQQGVSDTVVNVMLSQPKPGGTSPASTMPVADMAPAPPVVEPPPMDAEPPVDAAPPEDSAPPASTVSVYVIPDTATYTYQAAQARPGSIWYFSTSVVYIGGGGWVGNRGGWHGGGGWHSTGGWHSSGGWHH